MSIYSAAVKKPITTIMIYVGIVVLGIYSYIKLPIDFFPELEAPIISVVTFYNGANAIDIEENITRPLEDNFSTLSNMEEITSVSKDNISIIMIEFEWGANLDEASNEIRDALSRIEAFLPEEVETPSIFKFSSSMMPIMMLTATADKSYEAITEILEEKLVNPINRISGVGSVNISGGPKRAIMVDIDPRKLDAYHISLEQLAGVLQAENLSLPGGRIKMSSSEYPIRVQGEFESSDVIKDVVIGNFNGAPLYLRDVAEIRDGIKELNMDERANGKPGVTITVQKQTGANTVKVAKEVKELLASLETTLPPDIEINMLFDTSEYIQDSVSNLSETLFYAGLFVVLVVLFFLGRWRATIIIVLTIPISLIVAFIYLMLTGDSINIISLSSLSIAIGMVVDDAIVVLENITTNLERGSYPREAAIYGTNEVSLAIVASTLTILAVFMPLTMVTGFTGTLFRSLGFVVSITMVTSLVAALTLIPVLSSMMLRLKTFNKHTFFGRIYHMKERMLDKLDDFYGATLAWSLKYRRTVAFLALGIFIGSTFLVGLVGAEFFPASDNGRIGARVELAQGVKLEETSKTARKIEALIQEKYPEIEMLSVSAGSGDEDNMGSLFQESGSFVINLTMSLVDREERDRDIFEISELLREDLARFPEIEKYNVDPGGSRNNSGMGGGNNLEVKIFGYDIDQTNLLAEQIAKAMEELDGAQDVLVSRQKEKPELQVVLDREKMAYAGLNTATVATAIRNRVNGLTATKYREDGEEYDVILRYAEGFRQSTADLENITIMNARNQLIRLKDVGRIEQRYSPPSIEREGKERVVTVSALAAGADLAKLTQELNKKIANMDIPAGIAVEMGGSVEDMQESFVDLTMLLLLSILLVYIVMAAQFESLREPFIIMFSLPFAFSGVFLALFITGTTLNIISMIGAVMLVGIVVKNGIVLVDYTNLLRDRGVALGQAIVQAGRSRLRPVLMTTLTTLLAMVPLAVSAGEGSEMWKPMGITIIGGLLFSTLVTLVLVPVVYSMFGAADIRKKRKKLKLANA